MRALIDQIKKTIIVLGKANERGGIQFYATGFLVSIQNIFHLVTAKHIVMKSKEGKFTGELIDNDMLACFNTSDGKIGKRPIALIKQRSGANWIFHENDDVDVAIIPFAVDIQKDDVRAIPDNIFLTSDRLFELYDVFFLSYQPGIEPRGIISPVIRNGTISLINNDRTFYIDASAFPGNSGSPLFLKPSLIRFGEEESVIAIGHDKLGGSFIGVVGAYLAYQEEAKSTQTGRTRIVFEENTGLSHIWSVSFIQEIMESEPFKRQLDKFIKGNPQSAEV